MTNYSDVEEIVLEVLRKLERTTRMKTSEKRTLLVINASHDSPIKKLEEKWNVVKVPLGSTDIPLESAEFKNAIFFNTTQDLLVKGAIGIADTPESVILSKLLMQGSWVGLIPSIDLEWMLSEVDSNHGNSEYIKQLVKYKSKLEKFDTQILSSSDFILFPSNPNNSNENDREQTFHEKLLTENHVEKFKEKTIVLSKSTIVTPLAKDKARQLGKIMSVIES